MSMKLNSLSLHITSFLQSSVLQSYVIYNRETKSHPGGFPGDPTRLPRPLRQSRFRGLRPLGPGPQALQPPLPSAVGHRPSPSARCSRSASATRWRHRARHLTWEDVGLRTSSRQPVKDNPLNKLYEESKRENKMGTNCNNPH